MVITAPPVQAAPVQAGSEQVPPVQALPVQARTGQAPTVISLGSGAAAGRLRVVRWFAASILLAWLASPHWAAQLDDLFITLAYAHEWATTGVLRWTSGEVSEGYSNFLHLLLLTPLVAIRGDGGLLAKLISMACGVGILGLFSALLPVDRRGHLLLFALAVWAPLEYWSIMGLETTLFALLVAAGWMWVLRGGNRWGPGILLLALSALARPDGMGHLGLGLLTRVREPLRFGRSEAIPALALIAFSAYHALRVAHFGAFWPNPYLVKIAGVFTWQHGIEQWGRELATAAGLLSVIALLYRPALRDIPWILAPLAVQSALLLRADGDWMAWGRFLVPGVVAATLATVAVSRIREARTGWLVAVSIAAVLAGGLEPRAPDQGGLTIRAIRPLRHPLEHYTAGLGTTIPEDVEWVVSNVPPGDTVLVSDVGMVGNIPGVRVRDLVGLVDREVAELRAKGVGVPPDFWGDRFGSAPGQIAFVRMVDWTGAPPRPLPGWMEAKLPWTQDMHVGQLWAQWHRAHQRLPTRAEILERWRTLYARYPSQPWLREQYEKALEAAASRTGPSIR